MALKLCEYLVVNLLQSIGVCQHLLFQRVDFFYRGLGLAFAAGQKEVDESRDEDDV